MRDALALDPKTYQGMSKVQAIKALREALGPSMTLTGSKALLDSWESNGWWSAPRMAPCPHCNGHGQVSLDPAPTPTDQNEERSFDMLEELRARLGRSGELIAKAEGK